MHNRPGTILFLCIIVFTLISCSNNKTNPCRLFTDEENIYSEIINLNDGAIFYRPFLLLNVDSFIIATDVYEKKLFTAINLNTKKSLRFGNIGSGPGEFLIGTFCSRFMCTRDLVFFNSQTKNYYKSSIDSFLKNPDFRPAKSILFNSEIKKLNAFNDSVFVAEGSFGNCRLALYNEKGLLLNTILKYPEIDQANTKEYLRLAYQGKFSLKPNDMKFAYMTYNSSNIGFYKIEGKEIHLIKEIFLQNPLKELTSSGDLKACVPLKDCKVGYSDIFSTQKFLYALYSDEKVLNNKSKSSDILVYDWNGNPIKILKLDKKVSFICVSENDSILYAISNDGREVNILSFKLL